MMEISASTKMRLIAKARARHGDHLLPAGTRASLWDSFGLFNGHILFWYNVPGDGSTHIIEEVIE